MTHCTSDGATVWYVYTPSASGYINANTFGSDYDTTPSVYTGSPGTLTEIACSDDATSTASRVVIPLTAGVTYYFMVGSFFGGPGGNLVFNVDVCFESIRLTAWFELNRIWRTWNHTRWTIRYEFSVTGFTRKSTE
jgi:hypothetical protein